MDHGQTFVAGLALTCCRFASASKPALIFALPIRRGYGVILQLRIYLRMWRGLERAGRRLWPPSRVRVGKAGPAVGMMCSSTPIARAASSFRAIARSRQAWRARSQKQQDGFDEIFRA